MTGTIFDIKRFAIHDGPGIRTSVFIKGCALRCLWCQNPEGQSLKPVLWYFPNRCIQCAECIAVCPEDSLSSAGDKSHFISIDRNTCTTCGKCAEACPTTALSIIGEKVTTEKVVAELLKDRLFYEESGGGITLTGGDPLFQPEFSLSILKEIKKYKIHTVLETGMYASAETIKKFIPYTDLFLLDLKLFDDDLHLKYTGASNVIIKQNFKILAAEKQNILVRVPLIPGYTVNAENLKKIKRYVSEIRSDIPIELLNFNPLARDKYKILGVPYDLAENKKLFSAEEMESFKQLIKD